MSYKRILVISDMHLPYQHKDAIQFLKEIKKEFKPDFVVNIGDLLDFHAINMHTHDPDLYSAGMELDRSKEYIKEIEGIYPEVTEVDSNHSSLVYRRALKYGMSRKFLKDYGDFLGTKKWKWVDDLTLTMSNGQRCFFTHGRSGLINQKSMAFNYAKNFKTRFILGCGIIINGVPRLLPMVLNNQGKWINKIV